MKLDELNLHNRDKNIKFEEKTHTYTIIPFNSNFIDSSKDKTISVSELIHSFFPKFDADLIIEKMMNSRNWENSKYHGMKIDEIKQSWEDNRLLAANDGTILHKDIELFYNDIEIKNESSEFRFFLDFKNDFENLTAHRTEWCIYNEEINLAGTIDILFKDKEGNYFIYDWKRSKKITEENRYEEGIYPLSHIPNANYWHYALQLNAYKRILEEKYDLIIKGMYIVCLHPNQSSYEKIEIVNMDEEIKNIFEERKKSLNS